MKPPIFIIRLLLKRLIKKEGLDGLLTYIPQFTAYYSPNDGAKFISTEAEVNDIIRQIPELQPIKSKLITIYHDCRDKCGLPL